MKSQRILLFLFLVFILILPSSSFSQNQEPQKVYKVAILPFMIHSQENLDYLREGINDILTSRITVAGRIAVIERAVVEQALQELKPARLDEPAAEKIGKKIGADFIVLGSITKVGEYISLDARLISINEQRSPVTAYTQEKGIDNVMVKINNFAQDIGQKILGPTITANRQEEPSGPVITHAFTVQSIQYGDILKVYIEAEDPEGKMARIATVVDQAGYGRYPTNWVFLAAPDQKYFKGYLQWNTFSSRTPKLSEGTPITLTVSVFGKSGSRSNEFAFPIMIESGGKRASSYPLPPPFDQGAVRKIGNITIELMDFTVFPH